MRAIILAAGAGTRLSPLTNGCPKCLVPAGSRLLLDYQIEALRGVGVKDIVLVIGYEAEQIRRHCGATVRYIENPDYLTTNSIYSFYLARRELDTDLFLFNCDILFHPDVLKRMLDSGHSNVVAVDSQAERLANEMNVRFSSDGCVEAISKELDPAQAQAQSVQLVKFDAAGASSVGEEVERLIGQQQKNVFPTTSYVPLIQANRLYCVEVGDLPWAEIDSIEDYDQAMENVVPNLERI
jgi:choline kinase